MITLRIRSVMWFAAGAAVSIALVWSLLAWRVFAAPGASESTIVAVTPTRVLDTRDPVNLGLAGPFISPASQKLQVTGAISTNGGAATVVPAGATGVLLNVTVVGPSAPGFVSIRPGDATGAPSTSSLNFVAGVNLPNSVQVSLPVSGLNAGQIDITYDAYGAAGPTTDVLIDVVGYMTNAGIQSIVADLGLKANTADVNAALAAKADAAQVNASLATKVNAGPVKITQGPGGWIANVAVNPASSVWYTADGMTFEAGWVTLALTGPAETGGQRQTLLSLTYCITKLQVPNDTRIDVAQLAGFAGTGAQVAVGDNTDRTAPGCYTIAPTAQMQATSESFTFFLRADGVGSTSGQVSVSTVTTTWGPRP